MSSSRYSARSLPKNNGSEFAKPRQPSRYPKRNLRRASFWNDSDDDNINSVPGRKSWADQCEEYENDLHSPIRKSPAAANVRKPRRWENRSNVITPVEGNDDEETEVKKGRNLQDMFTLADYCTTSDSGSESVNRASSRAASDAVSTESSSMNSSDNELDGDRIKQYETDPAVLRRRQKQIDYGKNTKAYKAYLKAVPRRDRKAGEHIFTPKKHIVYSRRSWDNQIKIWRKRLHEYDPESDNEDDNEVDLSGMISLPPE